MRNNKIIGHIAALAAVIVWGTTFISSKILLQTFTPVEVLVTRFVIGLAALTAASPRRMKLKERRQEICYALAGLTGVTLYYLLENIALTYTFAANVGVIISTAPFFTAIVLHFFSKEKEPFYWTFLLGFVIAFSGIVMISLNGSAFHLSPMGDFLTILAALCWAFYSLVLKKINTFGYPTILNTRRIFAWGLVFMIPMAFLMGFHPKLAELRKPVHLLNFLYLGVIACAGCFVIWNFAVKEVGAIRTSVYIYADPAITVIASAWILHEPLTPLMIAGTLLTFIGLVVSEYRPGGS